MLSKEKEEFYQRVNRSNMDMIKNMESQLADTQVKFTERENYWRQRQGDLLKALKELGEKTSELEDKKEQEAPERMRKAYEE